MNIGLIGYTPQRNVRMNYQKNTKALINNSQAVSFGDGDVFGKTMRNTALAASMFSLMACSGDKPANDPHALDNPRVFEQVLDKGPNVFSITVKSPNPPSDLPEDVYNFCNNQSDYKKGVTETVDGKTYVYDHIGYLKYISNNKGLHDFQISSHDLATQYVYDKSERIIREVHYDMTEEGKGKVSDFIDFDYNKDGSLNLILYYDGDNTLDKYTEYYYDEKGNGTGNQTFNGEDVYHLNGFDPYNDYEDGY